MKKVFILDSSLKREVQRIKHLLKEFISTIFHEAMPVMFPELGDYIPSAEKILASVLNGTQKNSLLFSLYHS